MNTTEIFETRLVQPGRVTGIYDTKDGEELTLKDIYIPDYSLPFDLVELPNTMSDDGEFVRAILIDEISHPPNTRVLMRVLGGFENDGMDPFILGVPVAEQRYDGLREFLDFPAVVQEKVIEFIGHINGKPNSVKWLEQDAALAIVRQAIARLRLAKTDSEREVLTHPSWRPENRGGRVISYTEVEHYTDAEYTYFDLPYRFQQYMDQHLADDERILFAIFRPSMRSHLRRKWLRSQKMQAGVLIMTTQRLVQLVELVPPDSSGVRYGFGSCVGVLERLNEASIDKDEEGGLVLRTGWCASDGEAYLDWEFPGSCLTELEHLQSKLLSFVEAKKSSRMLRRANYPPVPETLPRLKDPAVNDPRELEPTIERFCTALPGWLDPDEQFLHWALLPAWFDKTGYESVFLATNQRLRMMPDPQKGKAPIIEVAYEQIAYLEFVSSILDSNICLSVLNNSAFEKVYVKFPYTAGSSFRACFEIARRCMAITPLSRAGNDIEIEPA